MGFHMGCIWAGLGQDGGQVTEAQTGSEAVRREYLEHIKSTFHDRAVDERIHSVSLPI